MRSHDGAGVQPSNEKVEGTPDGVISHVYSVRWIKASLNVVIQGDWHLVTISVCIPELFS